MPTDDLGRQPIGDAVKAKITEAFTVILEGKRGALLFIADTETREVRMHVAARFADGWKVAGGLGVVVPERRPSGWAAVEWAW
jgi:hypothetical protein